MRSLAEIRFRLTQEAMNAWFLLRPPKARLDAVAPLAALPDPEAVVRRLRGTAYAADVERIAGDILRRRFPLLGFHVETGRDIRWRRDYTSGIETGTAYFRRIPYLDPARAGDHKIVWEINRHQHLVLLAQAWRLTGRAEFLDDAFAQWESWMEANPFQRGINWASALEVAFRALSWIWVYHLAGERMPPAMRQRFLTALWRHGLHLERNLSIYFSRNTHLLGEAVTLHALGALFPAFPRARRWKQVGARVLAEEIQFQVRADGSYFEQSAYYHVYALDMLLFHAVLEAPSAAGRERLSRMADYLEALAGPPGSIPMMGDDDGGRFFHPYGPRNRFGRASLAVAAALLGGAWQFDPSDLAEMAAWWLGEPAWRAKPPARAAVGSRLFPDAGLAVMAAGDVRVYADAGIMGPGRAGHGHADTMSVVVRDGEREILIDPGTYTYVGEAAWRGRFRGTAAHNTVRIDGRDQAVPAGPFAWTGLPEVRILEWRSEPECDVLEAECRYAGFRHRRRIEFRKAERRVDLTDEVDGPDGDHLVEQFWHLGLAVAAVGNNEFRIGEARLRLDPKAAAELSEGGAYGWRSTAFGVKHAAPVIRAWIRTRLPVQLRAVLWTSQQPDA